MVFLFALIGNLWNRSPFLWWSVVSDGTSTTAGRTHHGDKIRLLLQVKDSGKRVWMGRELDGKSVEKEVMGAVENYLENCAH